MASYVILGNYTQQGVGQMKQLRSRIAATKQALEAAGGRQICWYLTMGQYDFVAVIEVPDTMTAARLALTIGAQGNIRTTTMQALTEDEAGAVVDALP